MGRIILLDMKNIEFDSSVNFPSPIGRISLFALGEKIVNVVLEPKGSRAVDHVAKAGGKVSEKALQNAQKQIVAYLEGKSQVLDFDVSFNGTKFQEAVWKTISKIKFGQTLTYAQIAQKVGSPAAVRAVGGAVGANPLPLRIGCHRVLGSGEKITGYSGGDGLETKKKLLALEKIEYR